MQQAFASYMPNNSVAMSDQPKLCHFVNLLHMCTLCGGARAFAMTCHNCVSGLSKAEHAKPVEHCNAQNFAYAGLRPFLPVITRLTYHITVIYHVTNNIIFRYSHSSGATSGPAYSVLLPLLLLHLEGSHCHFQNPVARKCHMRFCRGWWLY